MNYLLKQTLKTGDYFDFRTHAELLNGLFGTKYKAWMKSWWGYTGDTVVWFGRIDGKVRNNFKNIWLNNKDAYMQCYAGKTSIYDGKPLNLDSEYDYRLVFDIVDSIERKYIFKGFYRLNRKESTSTNLLFEKISDVFPIN